MARSIIAALILLAASSAVDATALRSRSKMGTQSEFTVNPMRKVVTMLQMMSKKVEAEGKKQDELFEKFFCYCNSAGGALKKSIADAEEKIPQLESDIKEAESMKSQLGGDVEGAKATREQATEAIAKAKSMREKDAAAFAKELGEDQSNLDALSKALVAIEKGMEGGFLQTGAAATLRKLSLTVDMTNGERDELASFLTAGNAMGTGYAPASGEIVGILKQMKDTMEKDLKEVIAQEETAKADFEALVTAKEKEIAQATKAIEEKIKRGGEVAVEVVNLKEDLEDTVETLAEDKKFLADLEKNCELKKKEAEALKKTRQEELIAIADTIKILNDDDAQELFKKAIPSAAAASLIQVENTQELRAQALSVLKSALNGRSFSLDKVKMALHSKKADMGKVIKMIDDLVALLGKEQTDDDDKKAYCEAEFDKADDKKKELERNIDDLSKAIEDAEEGIETLATEIKELSEGIYALDKEVAEATEQRKEEHVEFEANLAANSAAIQLIEIAKNRMQKFYNPKLYKPPPKRELSEEERITLNMGGTLAPTNPPGGIAGTGVLMQDDAPALLQVRSRSRRSESDDERAAPPPPPETPGASKGAKEESGGVLAMMDMMKADVEKDIQEMEFEEKDAQADYESMLTDAAEKRAADKKSIEEKEMAKAGVEDTLLKTKDAKAAEEAELMATKQYITEIHADCDFLIENYETRKEARTNEVDALKKAKAVLSGADYSLVQTGHRVAHRRLRA